MRAPASVPAEIAWRWTFGVAFWAVLYYSFREYFASVEIGPAEYAALRSFLPLSWMAITARVMVAIITGLRAMGAIIIPALAILWVALATLGRAATVRALSDGEPRTNWPSTVGLHVFRVVLTFAAFFAYFGCGILIDTLVGDPAQHFAAVFLLATLALLLIALSWSVINWFFSLAALFTVRDHAGFLESLCQTNMFYRRERNSFVSSGFGFSVIRTVLVIAVTIISLLIVSRYGASHFRATIALVTAISLGYFAIADALNLWRLAAYISFSEPEPEPPVVAAPEAPVQPVPEPQTASEVDVATETAPAIPTDEPARNSQ